MTIKTLTFIHELLIERESKDASLEKWCRNCLINAEDKGEPTEQLSKDKELATQNHNKSYEALREFECHEW